VPASEILSFFLFLIFNEGAIPFVSKFLQLLSLPKILKSSCFLRLAGIQLAFCDVQDILILANFLFHITELILADFILAFEHLIMHSLLFFDGFPEVVQHFVDPFERLVGVELSFDLHRHLHDVLPGQIQGKD
jgi:hypothetical protein